MLRVVCGQCGKKLDIPDAWARNVVKCPQCRGPIDLRERDSAASAVKLGQFLNENLAGGAEPSGKLKPPGRPAPSRPPERPHGAGNSVKPFLQRHALVVTIASLAVLLVVLDTTWFHTVTVTVGAVAGGVAAAAALRSEMTRHVPSAARRAELEYKVAMFLVALIGLRLAWFCYIETAAIVDAKEVASVAPALELLPKWGAILAVFLVVAVVLGAALGSLALVQRSSIYHVLSGGLVLLSLGYGAADVVTQQSVGVGVGQFVRQQLEPPPAVEVASGTEPIAGASATDTATSPKQAGDATAKAGLAANGAMVETSAHAPGAPSPQPEVIAWTAVADPPRAAPPKIGRRMPDIHLGSPPWNLVTPAVPSAWLAVGDNRREQSKRELWDLAGGVRLGELAGQIDFAEPVALSSDEPVIAGYIPSGMLVEVWSLSDGQMVGRLPCRDLSNGARPFIAFVAPQTLLLVYTGGANVQTPAVCQIWNFVRDEMQAEFVATGSSRDPKTQWAISPGRRYLAAADKSLLQVYDLIEKRLVGKVGIPAVPAGSPLDCAGVAFAPEGQQVTVLFRGDKTSRLIAWNLNDGSVLADREFNFDLAHDSPPGCRPIEPLPGGAGWLAFGRIIIPPFSGKLVLAGGVNEPPIPGIGMPRFAMALDAERLLVVANNALQIVKLPNRSGRASKGLLTLAQLLKSGATGSPNGKPAVNQRTTPAAGQTADGGVSDGVSRAYTRAAYIDFLSADDDQIIEQVRWAPWSKRPVFGLRLGLGVLPTNVPAKSMDEQRIEPVTGPIGPKLVAALDERLASGTFGVWPPGEDPRLTRVGWLGIGKNNQLVATANRQDLDIMVGVYVNWGKSDQRQVFVRVADLVNRLPIFNSSTLKVGPPSPGTPPAGDGSKKWLTDVLRQIDQKMTLQPMPDLTADDAKQAVERLLSSKHRDLAADLVEIRAYQARQLIDDATAAGYYEQLLGEGMGETFAQGDADERRKILEKVLQAD